MDVFHQELWRQLNLWVRKMCLLPLVFQDMQMMTSYFLGGDLNIRYGIGGNSDIGLSANFLVPGHIRFDYKRQLLTNSNNSLYLSSGLALEGYIPSEYRSMTPSFSVPLYFSFNHNKNVIPYFAQRYTMSFEGLNAFRYSDSQLPVFEEINTRNTILYSGGLGLAFGKEYDKWFLELSYFSLYSFFLKNYYSSVLSEWIYDKGQRHDNFGIQVSFGKMLFVKSSK